MRPSCPAARRARSRRARLCDRSTAMMGCGSSCGADGCGRGYYGARGGRDGRRWTGALRRARARAARPRPGGRRPRLPASTRSRSMRSSRRSRTWSRGGIFSISSQATTAPTSATTAADLHARVDGVQERGLHRRGRPGPGIPAPPVAEARRRAVDLAAAAVPGSELREPAAAERRDERAESRRRRRCRRPCGSSTARPTRRRPSSGRRRSSRRCSSATSRGPCRRPSGRTRAASVAVRWCRGARKLCANSEIDDDQRGPATSAGAARPGRPAGRRSGP